MNVGVLGASTEQTPYTTMPANFLGLKMGTPTSKYIIAEAKSLRDRGAQRQSAIGLRIPKCFLQERIARRPVIDQLAKTQRVHAALREVELHLVFVGGLHPFHRELFKSHVGKL